MRKLCAIRVYNDSSNLLFACLPSSLLLPPLLGRSEMPGLRQEKKEYFVNFVIRI